MIEADAILLARIDERTQSMAETVTRLESKMETHYVTVDEFKAAKGDIAQLENDRVTQLEFEPVKKMVYGTAGLILISVASAILALLFHPWGVK